MLKELPNKQLKEILKKRKETFHQYRISNGKFSMNTIPENTDKNEQEIENNEIDNVKVIPISEEANTNNAQTDIATKTAISEDIDNTSPSNNNASSDTKSEVKTYSERMKGGYFGRRRAR